MLRVMTDPITLSFAAALCVMLLTTTASPRRERDDAALVGLMLFAAWAFYKPMIAAFGWDRAAVMYPLTDCVQILVVLDNWLGRRRRWKVGIVALIVAKLCAHVVFRFTGTHGAYGYAVFLNAAFALEVACASWPGGERVGGWIGRHLSWHRLGSHHPVRTAGSR